MNTATLSYLSSLASLAQASGHRYLVCLNGDKSWQFELLSCFIRDRAYSSCCKLGGDTISGASLLSYKQGHQLLGRETACLIYDANEGMDANSLTAALGSLRGGGLFFFLPNPSGALSDHWIDKSLRGEVILEQDGILPALPEVVAAPEIHGASGRFSQQMEAVELIHKVVSGHRKRPLVITADRGRGKSAALGIAAAGLMEKAGMRILLTAPARKAVDPVFSHARDNLTGEYHATKNRITLADSYLTFVSPDELIRGEPECDLLLVDEASAIPIPMLIKILASHHRVVFSTTLHGYEGCGRGFTLKFFSWLDDNRSGWKRIHLKQPIRWNVNDPLEQWSFSTFLLDAELDPRLREFSLQETVFRIIPKSELIESDLLFRQCFALLVNAHYQTTPNDLMQILDDESVHLFALFDEERLIGCIIGKEEGALDAELITAINLGKRRPKGHLAPVVLSGQLGIRQAATQRCIRIMRIAVHPDLQGRGAGSYMLSLLWEQTRVDADYLATSFGVTSDLLEFWVKNGYRPARLGASLDQASGTYSLLMLREKTPSVSAGALAWIESCEVRFVQDLLISLPEYLSDCSPQLILKLLKNTATDVAPLEEWQKTLIDSYLNGGSCYENLAFSLTQLLLSSITENECHPLLVSKLLQKNSWSSLAQTYSLSGRKEAEKVFKLEINKLRQFTV